ncbi:MAG: FHA domain-containing protein [Prevotella sp.]|nr:FHA domain-containing protein [Prevotella sp.]
MIICPACKEEIDDDSHYCDQCGQGLLFCSQCGRVGLGRRCTHCGGLMVSPDERRTASNATVMSNASMAGFQTGGWVATGQEISQPAMSQGMTTLTLANDSLNIRIVAVNGAIIGRRKGPYTQFFTQHPYVSGVHAQLKYKVDSGWCVADKHSSNGTKLNQRVMQPDVDMKLSNGDILTLANINLQVIIR